MIDLRPAFGADGRRLVPVLKFRQRTITVTAMITRSMTVIRGTEVQIIVLPLRRATWIVKSETYWNQTDPGTLKNSAEIARITPIAGQERSHVLSKAVKILMCHAWSLEARSWLWATSKAPLYGVRFAPNIGNSSPLFAFSATYFKLTHCKKESASASPQVLTSCRHRRVRSAGTRRIGGEVWP